MSSRRPRREFWRKTKTGSWACSLSAGGYQVRLFENRSGYFYRDVHHPDGSRERMTLGTSDRREAERLGRELLAALLSGQSPTSRDAIADHCTVILRDLFDRFLADCPMLLDNDPHGQAETRTRLAIMRSVIGGERSAITLTRNDVQQYEARRRRGGIRYGEGRLTGPVRQRTVQADVKLLKQVLNWGCTILGPSGAPILPRNPLQGVSVKGEPDIRRPVASQERFLGTRAAMQARQHRYEQEMQGGTTVAERRRAERRYLSWVRAELALFLLEATGRRRGSIMGLHWRDIDFVGQRITWQPERDKKRKTWVVAYPESLFGAVRESQRKLGVVGGYVFPREDDADRPAPRELLSQWIQKAEQDAGLSKLAGGTCHPYRRKWRTERTRHPIKAVAVAGGWTDLDTMLRCYDQPDEADVLAVTSETRKRSELPTAAAASAT